MDRRRNKAQQQLEDDMLELSHLGTLIYAATVGFMLLFVVVAVATL